MSMNHGGAFGNQNGIKPPRLSRLFYVR